MTGYEVHVLHTGYSKPVEGGTEANCSCVLVKGSKTMIVDTMTPWDSQIILQGLNQHGVTRETVDYVVSTHGHSDHTGNNHLFLNAVHIVGHCISRGNRYFDEPFTSGKNYVIDDNLKIVPTPGHTLSDVSVFVRTAQGIVAIAGDLFEKEEDIDNEYVWLGAGSESPTLQRYHRARVAAIADYIIPGHGPIFQVTQSIKNTLTDHIF